MLLAEANIPYSQLYELEQINSDPAADVAVVVGANDVVNRTLATILQPIAGMPIPRWTKQSRGRLKRSNGKGFSGLRSSLQSHEMLPATQKNL